MKSIIYFLSMAFLSLVIACTSPKEKQLQAINQLEEQDSVFSMEQMAELKDAYLAFAKKYPDDEQAPEFLFKAGQRLGALATQNNDTSMHYQAIEVFKQVCDVYPKSHFAEEGLFLIGFVYENHLADYDNARKNYELFLAKFPKSELAEDAEISIENMGTDPLDIIKKANAGSVN